MNNVSLIGRLTKDPELRYTPSNTAVANFTLAVDRFGSKEKEADFINCVAWQKCAEFVSQYFTKGLRVGLTGSIQVRSYQAKDGTTRYVTEVRADKVYFADGKKDSYQAKPTVDEYREDIEDSEEELPF